MNRINWDDELNTVVKDRWVILIGPANNQLGWGCEIAKWYLGEETERRETKDIRWITIDGRLLMRVWPVYLIDLPLRCQPKGST